MEFRLSSGDPKPTYMMRISLKSKPFCHARHKCCKASTIKIQLKVKLTVPPESALEVGTHWLRSYCLTGLPKKGGYWKQRISLTSKSNFSVFHSECTSSNLTCISSGSSFQPIKASSFPVNTVIHFKQRLLLRNADICCVDNVPYYFFVDHFSTLAGRLAL